MFRFIVSRFLQSAVALFVAITVTFFMLRFAPGGPFTAEKAVTPAPPATSVSVVLRAGECPSTRH